jgi:glutamate carboxypeptidase
MKRIVLTFVLIGLMSSIFAQTLSKTEKNLIAEVEKNYQETVALLEEVTNINSGSLNAEGVEAVAKVFEREFQKIGFETEWLKLPAEVKRS